MTSLVVVGLNYRTSPVALLERLSIAEDELPKALHQLLSYEHVLEGVVLSTCNRVEVAASVSRFHGGAQDLRNFLAEFCHVAPEDFADHLYTYHDDGAARHLFRVAAGLDSMVVGESEILGQVRRAFQVAVEEGVTGRVLGHAFRRALSVGKRARTETAIARNPASFSTAAVELARRAFGTRSLDGKRVLVVGAGTMGKLSMHALDDSGVTGITIVSRRDEAARSAAQRRGAQWRPLSELEDAMAEADIIVTSTTSPAPVIERVQVERALARRKASGPLFIADVAVPRDVDPSVAALDSVILRDIDDLRAVVETGLGSRRGEITHVEAIISSEIDRFLQWQRADELSPAIAALVASADQLRAREVERAARHLGELSPAQREAIDHLSRRIVAKLLHTPIRNVRHKASSKQGYLYLQTLRELFELDDDSSS